MGPRKRGKRSAGAWQVLVNMGLGPGEGLLGRPGVPWQPRRSLCPGCASRTLPLLPSGSWPSLGPCEQMGRDSSWAGDAVGTGARLVQLGEEKTPQLPPGVQGAGARLPLGHRNSTGAGDTSWGRGHSHQIPGKTSPKSTATLKMGLGRPGQLQLTPA